VDDPLPLKFMLKVTHPLSNTTISTNIRLRLSSSELFIDGLWVASAFTGYVKFALKVTHRFRECRFQQISLNSDPAVRAGEKKFNYR